MITAGQSGNGTGEVPFSVAGNPGPSRVGGIRIAGQTLAINQASGCAISVTPISVSVAAAPSTNTIQVTGAQGCTWSTTPERGGLLSATRRAAMATARCHFRRGKFGPRPSGDAVGWRAHGHRRAGERVHLHRHTTFAGGGAGRRHGQCVDSDGCGLPLDRVERGRLDHAWRHLRQRCRAGAVDSCPEQWSSRTGTVAVASAVLTVNQGSPCEWVLGAALPYLRPRRREWKYSRGRDRCLHVDGNEQYRLDHPNDRAVGNRQRTRAVRGDAEQRSRAHGLADHCRAALRRDSGRTLTSRMAVPDHRGLSIFCRRAELSGGGPAALRSSRGGAARGAQLA